MKNKLSSFIYYLSVLFFIIAFNFSHNPPAGNWYQQWMPFLNNRPLSDITFIDSLTGFAVTGDNTVNDTNYILRTTNSGDNWSIVYRVYRDLSRVQFVNQNTGFVCGGFNAVGGYLTKTTNGGINWNTISAATFANHFDDMFVLNEDTLWLVDDNGFNGGVYRTTNGGTNWILQQSFGGNNPNKVYMYNGNIGFISRSNTLRKTTDSGFNWTLITGENGFSDIYFVNSLTGWKSYGPMKKTTNGGINWTAQVLPSGGIISTSGIGNFSKFSADTIWGSGGVAEYPNLQSRGILYRTINGGQNWLFQIPDTSFNIYVYGKIPFYNGLIGWTHSVSTTIHTVTGGDTTFLLPVNQISSDIPNSFILLQNYPNPFNPRTNIKYQIINSKYIKLIVYDIQGKEVITLVNQKQSDTGGAGTFVVDFDGTNYSSGIYFYSLFADGKLIDTKKMILIK